MIILLKVGGYDGASRQCLNTVEAYNPDMDTWSPVTDMCARRSGAGVNYSIILLNKSGKRLVSGVGVLNGLLYAVGGHDGPLVRKSVESFDVESQSWTAVSDMALCRRNAGVVAMNGLLYVVGGDDGSSNLASVEVYNPKTDTWTMLPSSMGIGRSYSGVVIMDKPI